MKIIIIDGGPASGKNTLGELLVQKFQTSGNKAILLDLDVYVEKLNPTWTWTDKQKEEEDQAKARNNYLEDINNYLQKEFSVIAIGERILTRNDLFNFLSKVQQKCPILLYHLSVPFNIRESRLYQRGPHSLINLGEDQKDRDEVKEWPGYIYENVNTPEEDADKLITLIDDHVGEIKF